VPAGLFGGLDSASLVRLAETGLIGLIGLLALLLVLRPMVLRLTTLSSERVGGDLALMLPGASPAGASVSAEVAMSAPGGGPAIGLLEDESMVSIAQIEGQLRASSIRRVSDLAEKHPNETLSILRGWMAQESS
jgi:flagellar M-ring protein FliF